MEASGSSKMNVTISKISCHHSLEDCSINMCQCQNLISQTNLLVALLVPYLCSTEYLYCVRNQQMNKNKIFLLMCICWFMIQYKTLPVAVCQPLLAIVSSKKTILVHSYNKTNKMHEFLNFVIGIKLNMFRTAALSIVRSLALYIWQQVYVIQVLLSAC